MIYLRDYQQRTADQVTGATTSISRVLLQMPTGSGKTVTAVSMVSDMMRAGAVWFICHRREILRQSIRAFGAAGINAGVVAPGHKVNRYAGVQVISIGTLRARGWQGAPPHAVFWDEAHHVAAKSWAKVQQSYPDAIHIGLTATPERLDGKGLENHFDAIICGPTIAKLIAAGHLARYRYFAPTVPDLTDARLRAGDYRIEDADRLMNTPVLIGDAVAHYQRICSGARALVFATSVEASRAVADRFLAAGIPAKHIDGTTSDDERDAAVADLAAGRLKVLSNVNVFSEGVDVPELDAVILLRPTKSLALWLQMIGRALRPCAGKDAAVILDHSGLVYEHGFPDDEFAWSLQGGARRRRLETARKAGPVVRRCPKCSCAHAMAAVCPECGYEYPTGREVGEYDGQLWEVRGKGDVPEGYETVTEFAARFGAAVNSVSSWKSKGLPSLNQSKGAPIPVEAGVAWVLKNTTFGEAMEGSITARSVAETYDVLEHTVRKWIRRGLPCDIHGNIVASTLAEWVHKNTSKLPIGYVSSPKFADHFGVTTAAVDGWRKRGMPSGSNGIPFVAASEWVENNTRSSSSLVSKNELCRILEVDHKTLDLAFGDRLPLKNGFVVKEDAIIIWGEIAKRKSSLIIGLETRRQFSFRVSASPASVTLWASRGLPCASNGLVHIRDGLFWVKANTKIKIPDSAWEGVERPDDALSCAAE